MQIFVDSDVVISSLLSSTGAAHFLLFRSQIKPILSSISLVELRVVNKRLGISGDKLETLVKERCKLFKMSKGVEELKKEYGSYVIDINDAHIVAAAHQSEAKYLISYNLKHFKTDKINSELDILILTPALFLQYLRGR